MALRSLIRLSRDLVLLLSAVAMVLSLTLAPHRPSGREGQVASAEPAIVVENGIGNRQEHTETDRIASADLAGTHR